MTSASLASTCRDCGADVAAGLLACPGCARLVHAVDLAGLAAAAQDAERAGDRTQALASWRRALDLLPPGTAQGEAIHKRIVALSAAVDGRGPSQGPSAQPATKKGGKAGAAAGAGAVGVALLKSKALLALLLANGKLLLLGLLKVPTLLSMLIYMHWWSGRGVSLALGVVASIYVHEMGHVATLRRYGIEASAPMFVPGLGAFVRLKQYPADAHEDARTGLAGPLWGLFAACVAAVIGKVFDSSTALSVASLGATINCFNLVPVWQLDGARGLRALSRGERVVVAIVGLLAGLVFHQWMPAVVGLVIAVRAFGSDALPGGDRRMFFLFATLLAAHGFIATLGTLSFG